MSTESKARNQFRIDYRSYLDGMNVSVFRKDNTYLPFESISNMATDKIGDWFKGMYQSKRFYEIISTRIDSEIKELYEF